MPTGDICWSPSTCEITPLLNGCPTAWIHWAHHGLPRRQPFALGRFRAFGLRTRHIRSRGCFHCAIGGGIERTTARSRGTCGLPVVDRGGRGVGEDTSSHASPRVPSGVRTRESRGNPGHHVHEQGRGRNAGAHCGSRGGFGPFHVDLHVPLPVRTNPAPGGQNTGPDRQFFDLRRRRLPASNYPGGQAA